MKKGLCIHTNYCVCHGIQKIMAFKKIVETESMTDIDIATMNKEAEDTFQVAKRGNMISTVSKTRPGTDL